MWPPFSFYSSRNFFLHVQKWHVTIMKIRIDAAHAVHNNYFALLYGFTLYAISSIIFYMSCAYNKSLRVVIKAG